MSEYLPQELMLDIFMRLPIKSILQCTSLCKSCLFSDNENLDQCAQFDLPFDGINYFFNIVGCCNGILCLNDEIHFSSDFYLWNPSIRKSVKLPNPRFWSIDANFIHKLGFGFDPVTNDYQVVRVLDIFGISPIVELYKLSTGVWKDISDVLPSHLSFFRTPQVYLNGASHWVGFQWEEGSPRIIIFFNSLVSEIQQSCEGTNLYVLDESLCLVYFHYDETIDIWMMKEYGEAESWVKHYNITSRHIPYEPEVNHYLIKPMATSKNGEML
ncbi:F-box protein At3g07870-like [Lycium barbarum]|uniref:F-box protein At3g07870-like n=1 Tax=Lycium barbarum TaxID=112863 RepID=UPI00293EC07A|nr:F-box protein At3g07870-like [Lycium barbarum]